MPSGARTIIIGGGINATNPFNIGLIPVIVDDDPPSLSQSIMGQTLVGNLAIINFALGDPNAAATEDFKWRGGFITEAVGSVDSVVIGRGASPVGGSGAIAIGLNSVTNSGGNVAIGNAASATSSSCVSVGNGAISSGNSSTAIGQGAQANGGGGGGGSVAIGQGALATGAGSVVIGGAASGTVASGVVIGVNATASVGSANVCIGNGASVDSAGTHCTIVGQGSRATTGQGGVAIGCEAEAREQGTVAIGGHVGGVTLTQVNTVRSIGIGADLVISAGHTENIGIGSGLRSFAANTAMIGGPNTIINTMVIGRGDTATTQTAVVVRLTNRTGAGNLAGSNLTVRSGAGVGNDLSAGQIILATPVTAAGGTTQGFATRMTIGSGGVITVAAPDAAAVSMVIAGFGGAGQGVINFTGTTNGAGAAAGTLLNAPSAGDPSFWLPIEIAGATRFIPCWT